jgi:hypothetical protein
MQHALLCNLFCLRQFYQNILLVKGKYHNKSLHSFLIIYFILFSFLLRANGGKPCYHKNKFDTLWLYFVYKLSLTHCIESFAFASIATLDATLVLPVTDKLPVGVAKIFLGIRVVLVYGICFLYLQKILHGDRTLFATPGESSQPVRRGGKETEV